MDRRQMLQLAAGAAAGILTGGMHVPFSQETLYPEWCDKRLWRHQATSGKLVRDVQADLGLPGAAMPSNRNWHTLEMGPTPLLRLSGSRAVREFARSYGVGVTDLPNRTFMGRLFPRMFSESDAAGWWHNEPAWMDKARLKNKRGTQVLQDQRASAVVGLCSAKDLKNYEIDMGGGVVLPKGLELMPPHDCVSRKRSTSAWSPCGSLQVKCKLVGTASNTTGGRGSAWCGPMRTCAVSTRANSQPCHLSSIAMIPPRPATRRYSAWSGSWTAGRTKACSSPASGLSATPKLAIGVSYACG